MEIGSKRRSVHRTGKADRPAAPVPVERGVVILPALPAHLFAFAPVWCECSYSFHSGAPAMPYGYPASIIGMIVSGDLGSSTIYTDRFGRKVEFPKSPPKTPPSPGQQLQRQRFRDAQQAYMALPDAAKLAWELLASRASLAMTGQNLYIHFSLGHNYDSLQTLCNQTRISVANPPWL